MQKRPASLPAFSVSSASHLDQWTARGRPLRSAAGRTARFRLARRGALARARQLLGFRCHRSVEVFEADLFLRRVAACLVLDEDDANMASALQLTEQQLVS